MTEITAFLLHYDVLYRIKIIIFFMIVCFLQHLREKDSNIEYFVIGAAHVVDTSQEHKNAVPEDSLLFYYAEKDKLGGFAYVQGSPDGLHFVFANGFDSKDIYHAVIKPRSFFWKHRQVVYHKTSIPSTDV